MIAFVLSGSDVRVNGRLVLAVNYITCYSMHHYHLTLFISSSRSVLLDMDLIQCFIVGLFWFHGV